MKLISGASIKKALQQVAPTHVAVAYTGIDWSTYIDKNKLKEIILSPTLGTNPHAVIQIVDTLGWKNVHFLDHLHSKIYLGAEQAAVGSFNLSANGMSEEGLEEVGFLVQDQQIMLELRTLHNRYKKAATDSYPTIGAKKARLAQLREVWDRGITTKVIRNDSRLNDIENYQPLAADEIYISCAWGNLTYNEDVVSISTIEDSLSFLEEDDVRPDRWILYWHANNNGYPHRTRAPKWMHIDEIVSGGAIDTQYTKLANKRTDRTTPHPPFELTDEVAGALRKVLQSDLFPEFLGNRDRWSLNDTLARLPEFLDALRAEVNTSMSSTGRSK
jgi:hypothetical protein